MEDHDNEHCTSSSCSSEEQEDPFLTAEDGLSSDVFALLQQFQIMQNYHDYDDASHLENNNEREDEMLTVSDPIIKNNVDDDNIDDSSVIASTMRRLQRQQGELAAQHERIVADRHLLDLAVSSLSTNCLAQALQQEGVVRINGVLTDTMCDECLELINMRLAGSDTTEAASENHVETENEEETFNLEGFGNVFSRKNRYDMFLRNEGVFELALASMLHDGSILGDLFTSLLDGLTGNFHEFSSLISDPTSASQSIHPDSSYTEHAPIWTVFVALQDIQNDMGPTIFLPRTNTLACHDVLGKSPFEKEQLLATCQYRRSSLRKGDCAIMDSRLFHFGGANESQTRRVLLYFTIQNPKHVGAYPPGGSLFPELVMKTQDYAAIRT